MRDSLYFFRQTIYMKFPFLPTLKAEPRMRNNELYEKTYLVQNME